MNIIKGILAEELKNSLRIQKQYEKTLAGFPRGVLVKKTVKGRQYYYLMMRDKGKVRSIYKGKLLAKDVKYYQEVRKDRARYRKHLAEVNKRVAFLKKALQGKDLRALS
jgi:hypothetical protein